MATTAIRHGRARAARAAALAALIALASSAAAAQSSGLANTLSGFSANSDKPIAIRSDVIELYDRDRTAVFSGNVIVTQDEVTIRTSKLQVEYEAGAGAAAGGADMQRRISRIEALDKVLVTLKDQKLSGDSAVFEMKKQIITVLGDVVLTQGDNVLRGSRLVVDLNTGRSRLESGTAGGGRVQGSFVPEQRARPADRPDGKTQ